MRRRQGATGIAAASVVAVLWSIVWGAYVNVRMLGATPGPGGAASGSVLKEPRRTLREIAGLLDELISPHPTPIAPGSTMTRWRPCAGYVKELLEAEKTGNPAAVNDPAAHAQLPERLGH